MTDRSTHFAMPHAIARDTKLPLSERGLMAYLYSVASFDVGVNYIFQGIPETEHEELIKGLLNLEELGYIHLEFFEDHRVNIKISCEVRS